MTEARTKGLLSIKHTIKIECMQNYSLGSSEFNHLFILFSYLILFIGETKTTS